MLEKSKIISDIKHCGDSLVIAGSTKKMRIHIHTDFPAELFSILQRYGSISYQKVDDMIMQNEILHNRKSNVAILTDSSCDLPKELLDKHQIHVVPLGIHFGSSFYLDRLTIQPPHFYSLLEKSEQNPSSAQPAFKEFQNKYEYLCMLYGSVIGINISGALSGTFFNSSKAGKEVGEREGKNVSVFDSKTLTGGLGLLLLRIARELEKGESYEDLLIKIKSWIPKTQVRVSVPTLKYIVRSGRVSKFKSFIATKLDLKPVISLDEEGRTYLFSKSFSEKGSMKKAMLSIKKLLKNNKLWGYTITHANNQASADWYASEMEQLTGLKPVYVDHASPALVANTGPGVVCVSLMME
jgi:hypothetical protein